MPHFDTVTDVDVLRSEIKRLQQLVDSYEALVRAKESGIHTCLTGGPHIYNQGGFCSFCGCFTSTKHLVQHYEQPLCSNCSQKRYMQMGDGQSNIWNICWEKWQSADTLDLLAGLKQTGKYNTITWTDDRICELMNCFVHQGLTTPAQVKSHLDDGTVEADKDPFRLRVHELNKLCAVLPGHMGDNMWTCAYKGDIDRIHDLIYTHGADIDSVGLIQHYEGGAKADNKKQIERGGLDWVDDSKGVALVTGDDRTMAPALCYATLNNQTPAVKYLLANGADASVLARCLLTARDIADCMGNVELVKILDAHQWKVTADRAQTSPQTL